LTKPNSGPVLQEVINMIYKKFDNIEFNSHFFDIFGSAYEAGLPAEQKEMTEDVLTRLAERRNRSIIVARPSKNQILIGRPINYNIRDIHKGFYLVIEEEGHLPALIVPSKSTAVLEESQLPKTIRDDNRKRTKRPLIRK
jgi:hypothetical protein